MAFGDAALLPMQRQVLVLVFTRKAQTVRRASELIRRDFYRTRRTAESMQPLYITVADDGALELTPEGVRMARLLIETVQDRTLARMIGVPNA